jgi:hypothetical protein
MFDAGVDGPLSKLVSSARSLAAEFEGENLQAHEAARLVEQCAEAERLLAAIRMFAASTLEDKALWRREGFRSVAAWMAAKTGTAVGLVAPLPEDLPGLHLSRRPRDMGVDPIREPRR